MEKGKPDRDKRSGKPMYNLSAAMTLKMERVNTLFREEMSKNYLENGPKALFEKAGKAREKAEAEEQAAEEESGVRSKPLDAPEDEVVESVIVGAAIEQQAIVDTIASQRIHTMNNQVKEEMQKVSVPDIAPQSVTDLPQ